MPATSFNSLHLCSQKKAAFVYQYPDKGTYSTSTFPSAPQEVVAQEVVDELNVEACVLIEQVVEACYSQINNYIIGLNAGQKTIFFNNKMSTEECCTSCDIAAIDDITLKFCGRWLRSCEIMQR